MNVCMNNSEGTNVNDKGNDRVPNGVTGNRRTEVDGEQCDRVPTDGGGACHC